MRNKTPIGLTRNKPLNPHPSIPDEPDIVKNNPIAHREWERVIEGLEASNLLSDTDYEILSLYCLTSATWIEAIQKVAELGELEGKKWASIRNNAEGRLLYYITELGLSPRGRHRLGTNEHGKPLKQNMWEGLIN
jgi:P27 family predicted phage terminase small subunit